MLLMFTVKSHLTTSIKERRIRLAIGLAFPSMERLTLKTTVGGWFIIKTQGGEDWL